MFTTAVGVGTSRDSYKAGVEAAVSAKLKLSDYTPSLVLVFASPQFMQTDVLRGIRSVVGTDVPLAGASTAGEITEAGPVRIDSVVVMLLASNRIKFAVTVSEPVSEDGQKAGFESYQRLQETLGEKPVLVCMFADGLMANPAQVILGIEEAAGEPVVIVGGSAGDNGKFKLTYQYCGEIAYTDAVVTVGFSGALDFSVGVKHGWLPIGSPRKVTAAKGTLVEEIDGRPAIELYEEYLGSQEAAKLGQVTLGEIALAYPLGIKDPLSGEILLRAPFFVNSKGGITCGGEVAVGDEVQLMLGSSEEAIKAAKESVRQARTELTNPPAGVLLFSSYVRRSLFGTNERSAPEVAVVVEEVGKGVPLIGFYTYAEQAPVGGETCDIKQCRPINHNETLVTVLLAEKND